MLTTVTPPTGVAGAITGLYEDVLQGWALDATQPGVRLAVEVYIDGAFVALARADRAQPHDAEDDGDGFHGFAIELRKTWLEDARHIAVRVANQGPWLEGTLVLPAQAPKEPPVGHSQVWYPGGLAVTGWAWDPDAPERHIDVVALKDGKVIARSTANRPHPALIHRDSAEHGFLLDLPWALADGEVHTVALQDDQGRPLAGSPITVCTLPEGMQALLRRHWPGKPDDPELALMLRLAEDQDRRAPRTIGFAHYHEWFGVHQKPAPLRDGPGRALKAGVLLYGSVEAGELDSDAAQAQANAAAEATSRASLEAQRQPAHAIVRAEPGRLPQALHQLLMQDADAVIPLHVGDHLPPHAIDTLLAVLAGDADATQALGVRLQPTRGAAPDGWHERHETGQTFDAPAWAYADTDCDSPDGRRAHPWLKPAWDIDLFLGADIVTPGAIWSADIIRRVFTLGTHPPAGEIHDLAAAIALATTRIQGIVAHVPRVLHHQRATAPTSPELHTPSPARHAAMQWLASELAPGADVTSNPDHPALLQTWWPLPADGELPKVSLIVPTRDHVKLLRACVEGLLNETDYPNKEIIVVDNDSTCPDTLAYMEEIQTRGVVVLRYPHPFNYSAINNFAVEHATGEILGLINNDIEVIEPNWLRTMVAQLLQPGVGIVGAKLLWPNGMVQHAGVVVGVNGLAAHAGYGWRDDDAGYLALNHLHRQQAAVTAACLLTRKSHYAQSGGLDADRFVVAFNDVDFCLRTGRDQTIVWNSTAKLIHAESATRGKDNEAMKRARANREHMTARTRFHSLIPTTQYHRALNHDWGGAPYAGVNISPVSAVRQKSQ
ncbi:glycosyltransferase [Achromobacter sp. GG226]|uniref:glycosyltransferase family 2 protein n=1 Tax=Verticiella alkaliphila TaxID=2779529 RepID=UPI001C0D7404|nr:glycosyltransferase [Verticiella sp. GG226]MBU4609707.1 glycosyltransferase [Verticiella sp. GG226]